ncbi:MAG: heat-inducible transcription repressor HrcA [Erysipelotrichaceae bacterium]|nr:heat-inducible transcription repressor HrcA [Erysipelotrichaceae bacterium]
MLTARQLLIFKYIVEEFIDSAEPVGSKTLKVKYNLPYSSATIRNEMSRLEEAGYLEKTHTSSGRVPSKEGYRFYVETLLQPSVDDQIKNQVATIFSNKNRSLNEIIRQSCEMLSELTHLTTVALGPDSSYERLQNITLVPLSTTNVTAIIVTDRGHVENRIFTVDNQTKMNDLKACVDVMNETLVGVPIDEVVERLENQVKPILSIRIREHEALFNAFLEAFMRFANRNIYLSGRSNMLYHPAYNDVNKLRLLVSAFENSETWNSLMPMELGDGISVRIGNETPFNGLNDVSVITASFGSDVSNRGSISVIGPTRMPYEKVVSLVEYISENIESLLDEDD